jgi:hypothetical protein
LLFKRLETDDPALDLEVQIFVCAECGREHSRKLIHDPYTAHIARGAEWKGGPAKGSA